MLYSLDSEDLEAVSKIFEMVSIGCENRKFILSRAGRGRDGKISERYFFIMRHIHFPKFIINLNSRSYENEPLANPHQAINISNGLSK